MAAVELEPTAADLASIEAEWPVIELELELTGLELKRLGRPASDVELRRERHLVRQILAARLAWATSVAGDLVELEEVA
ncbi:hypothetical protein Lfu02_31480 [Longispora fulva]|nr:DUF6284 family protein [Longispora fulva]GIG58776.1 hypothetical protein Lfu02_31480 [Longispora fulva]